MKNLLDRIFGRKADGEMPSRFEQRHMAAAALMVEAALLDGDFNYKERRHIEQMLEARFQLGHDFCHELLAEAEKMARESVEWQGFTQAIKEGFSEDERIEIIEMLWEVVYADGKVHDYEASLMRRVAGLLYVDDRSSGEARKRVKQRLGITD